MADFHNDLKGLQGGQNVVGTGLTEVDDFYHLNAAKYASVQSLTSGEFSASLGVSSIVVVAGCLSSSKIFLMPQDSSSAGLATAIGYSISAGVGSFTATHGSAVSTAGKFSYLFI